MQTSSAIEAAEDAGRPAAFPAAHGIKYRPEVDGLRAIAVTSVILYHAAVWPFTGGYVGVDIFFVISGYLISAIIQSDLDSGKFTYANFYERRIRRIFPALFVVLLFSVVGAIWLHTPAQLRAFGQALVATVGFASNILFWLKTGYFDTDTENSALIHMWSLSVEEQFYLFFPVLLIALRRFKVSAVAIPLCIGLALSLAGCLYLEAIGKQSANFFLMPGRAWELLAGSLVAIGRPRWSAGIGRRRGIAWGTECIGALLLIAPLFFYTKTTSFPGIAAIPVVLGAALVLLASASTTPFGRVLASKPMVGIGLLSYSAYLWHQPLFAFARPIFHDHIPPAGIAAIVALTFALAWVSWRFVERPFRGPHRVARRPLFAGAVVATAIAGAVGLILYVLQGIPQRFPKEVLALAATAEESPKVKQCHNEAAPFTPPERACRYFLPNVTWAVLGDSHGVELSFALAEALKERGEGLVELTYSSCGPALSYASPRSGCSGWFKQAMVAVEREPNIKDVLLTYRYAYHLHGEQLATYPAIPAARPAFLENVSAAEAEAIFWRDFDVVVKRLLAAGKRVHIVLPVPDLPVSIERYIFGGRGDNRGVTQRWFQARNRDVFPRLEAYRNTPGVTLLDPSLELCDAEYCNAVIGNEAMYFDDDHLSLAGARRIVGAERKAGRLP